MEQINGWTIVDRKRTPKGGWALVALCPQCGEEVHQPAHALRKNKRCQKCFIASVYKGGNRTARHKVKYNLQVNQAKKRGLEMTLTDSELDYLWAQPCTYCHLPPSNRMQAARSDGKKEEFVYSGLDRVDNTKGYTIDNVVPCCKTCNRAKDVLGLEEFYAWIERVSSVRRETLTRSD